MDEKAINISQYLIDISNYEDKSTSVDKPDEGSFGTVFAFENKDPKIIEKYAGKIFKFSDDIECNQPLFFLREIHILTSNYPTILKLEGWCVVDKALIMTERMQNGSLYDALCNSELTATQKQIILYGIAKGMEYLHSKNIIYHDLKLENILLDQDFYPKICDFNLSEFTSDINQNIDRIYYGTEKYKSPEICNKELYNGKIDVYSYGILAFEIITDYILEGDRESIAFYIKEYDDMKKEFKKFILKCMNKKPDLRPTFTDISSWLKSHRLDDVDDDEFDKYIKMLDDFHSEETLIEFHDNIIINDWAVTIFNHAESLKKGDREDMLKAANLFKIIASLSNNESFNEFISTMNLLQKKDKEQNLTNVIYHKLDISQEQMKLCFQPPHPDPSLLYRNFTDIPFCMNCRYSNMKILFRIENLEEVIRIGPDDGKCYHLSICDLSGNRIKLEIYDNFDFLDYDQKQLIKSNSFVVSKSATVYENRGSMMMYINVTRVDRYICIDSPTIEELNDSKIITSFNYVVDNDLYGIPVGVVVAVTSCGSEKETPNGTPFMDILAIDTDYNEIRARVFTKEVIDLFKNTCQSSPSTPIFFNNAFFVKSKGKVAMHVQYKCQPSKMVNFYLSEFYDYAINLAENGQFYRSLFVSPLKFSDIDKEGVFYMSAEIVSVSFDKFKYTYLDRCIIKNQKINPIISKDDGKLRAVDSNCVERSLFLMPLVYLSVEIKNPVESEKTIKAFTKCPDVVNYLLNLQPDDHLHFYSMFENSTDSDDFENKLKKFVEENRFKKLNIKFDMILRIYSKNKISIEEINVNEGNIHYALKLRNESKTEKDKEKKKELFKESFGVFKYEAFNSDDKYAKYFYAVMSCEYVKIFGGSFDNIDEIDSILKEAADSNYKDAVMHYYNFLLEEKKDEKTVLLYLKKAADNDNCEAQFKYGKYLIKNGEKEKGMEYIEKASGNEYKKAKMLKNEIENKTEKEQNEKISSDLEIRNNNDLECK